MIPLVVVLSAWVLWHDVSVYGVAESQRVAGPTYEVDGYNTWAECETAQHVAMTTEELPRVGPTIERLLPGSKTWQPNPQCYTTSQTPASPPRADPPPSPLTPSPPAGDQF